MTSAESIALDLAANDYLSLIAFAVLYYDYTLTFGIEVDRFWAPRFSWASFLFYLNRYLGIFGHIPVILQLFRAFSSKVSPAQLLYRVHPQDASSCRATTKSSPSSFKWSSEASHPTHPPTKLNPPELTPLSACLIMRTYALYERARWVLWFLCGFALGVIIFGCWAITGKHTEPVPIEGIGCNTTLAADQGIHLAIAWSGMTAFDFVIFVLTVFKALRTPRVGRRTLADVLLQDGAMYFFFMVFSNIVNISTFVLGGPLLRGAPSTFTNVVSTTLISRLMLNVRDPSLRTQARPTTFSTAAADDSSGAFVSTVVDDFGGEQGHDEGDGEIELVPRRRRMFEFGKYRA
ncbi:hypothetical protein GLOTRDRAFT_139744 [Gloeophyllum trabeum ATCC 11539]|uniref:DUF6533 domain-containing protein n=1 Tax=Gloeophyllum trabeum (strain ATCC 11539 / FP-39264 / Madison 617) TaxID=670483 RepID=S7Q200_GLOTA|nr:uncharacterized protein GLOTRDRAFT_139744 [Gloeophyllum trabeum ATCC 11539]EPQ53547.1 hypothetical protein GLOTRDRAFT_139744 [Gloeophyllum trabeum ATCC 11539]